MDFTPSCFFGGLILEGPFSTLSRVENIIWNNKEIEINNKPVFLCKLLQTGYYLFTGFVI